MEPQSPQRPRGFREAVDRPRRFYKDVGVAQADGAFQVRLDGRPVRTPGGKVLDLPTRAIAELVAEEWAAQGETIEFARMHAARLTNTALEAVPAAREATADQVAQFASSDLTLYFAEEPEALVRRQAEAWEPVLTRVEDELGVDFARAGGIVHRPQPQAAVDAVRALALALDDFRLAGLAFATALYGSAVLAIAVQRGWLDAADAFERSRVDEAWQEERWGIDAEAAERVEGLRGEARMLERWLRALD